MTVEQGSLARADAALSAPAVAALGLPTVRPWPETRVSDAEWERILAEARAHRLTGLLHWATWTGIIPVTDGQAEAAAEAHLGPAAHVVRLEQDLLTVTTLLEHERVPHLVMKGPAVARLDYPDPEMRTFVDIDVLVPGPLVTEAVATLGLAGFERRVPSLRATFDRRFAKSVTLRSDEGLEIDLHRTIVDGPAARAIPTSDVWSQPEPVRVGPRVLDAPSWDVRLLHAAFAVAVADNPPRLSCMRDLAQMLLSPVVQPARLLDRADTWGARPVLARAVSRTWRALDLRQDTIPWWADSTGFPPTQPPPPSGDWEQWFGLYDSARGSFPALADATLRHLPWPERASFLACVALPRRDYLRHRGMGRLAYLRRGVTRMDDPT